MSKAYIHPLPIRVWHWINALGFVLLILTGLHIRYADAIQLMAFRTAVSVHNAVGFVLVANYFIWLCFYLFTDKIVVYHPELDPKKFYLAAFRQAMFYGYGIFKGKANPHHATAYHKFNALQSGMYQIIMIWLVPIQLYTGLLLWDPVRFAGSVEFFGGVRVVSTVHTLLFIFFFAFLFMHVYLASLGKTPGEHFKAMITGYEEVDDAAPHAGD
jgi:thiosulfate reductase cytochrome b subunit